MEATRVLDDEALEKLAREQPVDAAVADVGVPAPVLLRRLAVELLDRRHDADEPILEDRDREIRREERERLAALFEENADVLRSFQPDGLSIEMVAFLLRLDHG